MMSPRVGGLSGPMLHLIPAEKVSVGGCLMPPLVIAQQVGLADIDATIGADNAPGLAYYDAMGFETYQRRETSVSKRFTVRVQSGLYRSKTR